MKNGIKNHQSILDKLNIQQLNPMQEKMQLAFEKGPDIILLSPTGTGKTLAFLLPIIAALDRKCTEVQVLILVPSRELALQIEQVVQEMGTGYKTNAVYGGRSGSEDRIDLKHTPTILIGTPGRIADHLSKKSFSTRHIHTLVLDEFDKSLEVGFEADMLKIIEALPNIQKRILTSATQKTKVPAFIGVNNPIHINNLDEKTTQLSIKTIVSPTEDKLKTLVKALSHIGNQPGIIFCNFKDTIQEVSNFLWENKISHGCFHGSMEQIDRERALIQFRNGTHRLIVATDLAARGIDIPELKFIIHFQLPPRPDEFIHRNGRTARMNSDGTAYVLKWEKEELPSFIKGGEIEKLKNAPTPIATKWSTLYISGGRRDKISKGDVAGLFQKQGRLKPDELGVIEVKPTCTYVAVDSNKAESVIELVNNSKLKTKKVRISML